jgi:hypothetical protein
MGHISMVELIMSVSLNVRHLCVRSRCVTGTRSGSDLWWSLLTHKKGQIKLAEPLPLVRNIEGWLLKQACSVSRLQYCVTPTCTDMTGVIVAYMTVVWCGGR